MLVKIVVTKDNLDHILETLGNFYGKYRRSYVINSCSDDDTSEYHRSVTESKLAVEFIHESDALLFKLMV